MSYVIYYSDGGAPKEALSPTIDIFLKVSDGTSAGTPPAVSEVSGGFYKFDYTATEDTCIRVDSEVTTMSDLDRYIAFVATPYDTSMATMYDVETGRWLRDGSQLIFYKSDNVTEVMRFDLKKNDGTAANEGDDPYERARV